VWCNSISVVSTIKGVNRCDSEWHFDVLEEFPSLCMLR